MQHDEEAHAVSDTITETNNGSGALARIHEPTKRERNTAVNTTRRGRCEGHCDEMYCSTVK